MPRVALARNRGSCLCYLGLDISFDEYNYLNSLQALLADETGLCKTQNSITLLRIRQDVA